MQAYDKWRDAEQRTACNPRYEQVEETRHTFSKTRVGDRVVITNGLTPRWDAGMRGTILRVWELTGHDGSFSSMDVRAEIKLDGYEHPRDYNWSEFGRIREERA